MSSWIGRQWLGTRRSAARVWTRLVAAARLVSRKMRNNAALRERALASAAFAGIFAFGVLGIDYLITGGPDWNPGGAQAYAMEISHPIFVARPQTRVEAEVAPPALHMAFAEVDYSVATEDLLGGPDAYALYEATNAKGDEVAARVIVWSTPDADVGIKPASF